MTQPAMTLARMMASRRLRRLMRCIRLLITGNRSRDAVKENNMADTSQFCKSKVENCANRTENKHSPDLVQSYEAVCFDLTNEE